MGRLRAAFSLIFFDFVYLLQSDSASRFTAGTPSDFSPSPNAVSGQSDMGAVPWPPLAFKVRQLATPIPSAARTLSLLHPTDRPDERWRSRGPRP
jgi:hypothetical protein